MNRNKEEVLKSLRGLLTNEAGTVMSVGAAMRAAARKLEPYRKADDEESLEAVVYQGLMDVSEDCKSMRSAMTKLAGKLPEREPGERARRLRKNRQRKVRK